MVEKVDAKSNCDMKGIACGEGRNKPIIIKCPILDKLIIQKVPLKIVPSKPMERKMEFGKKVQQDTELQAKIDYINNIDIGNVEFFTKEEAAMFLKCSERSIDRAREKELPAYSLGREVVFIKEQLVKWVMVFGKI